ncbi:autotransporter-associated beta strand repeat-containing protein, partial [Brucella intermedia]|uniref:autotransporter-associated beta strand repeat-containing protein n=1 Tax=Brucella intermedia TaxID=94625 RepID=UPI00132552BE
MITGGDGGAFGPGVIAGSGGAGGDGIVGSNLKVVNSGSIRGGKGGAPGTDTVGKDGYAIRFESGSNRLELHAGSDITGIVYGARLPLGGNTFVLGGDEDATFAANITGGTTIDDNTQYYGFYRNEKTGTSTWSLTGRSESWVIKEGVLQIGDGGTKGEITGTVNTGPDANNKGTFAFNRSDAILFGGLISGTGNVRQLGGGTTVLTSDNTYSGGTILDGGTLSVSREANLGDTAGALTFNGGTLQITGTDFQSTGRTINWGSEGGGFDIAAAGNVFTVGQNLGAGGALTKLGAGTLVLSGTNTYKGGTTVSDGILQLGDGTTDGSILGNIVLGGGDLVVANQGATVLDGNISGTGSVTQDGTGKLTLSGNNSYGDTYLNAGVISVGQEENLGSGALNFDGGTLQVTGTHFKGTNKAINWGAGGGTFDIVDAGNEFALSNVFTGAGSLTKLGEGMLVLSGDSSGFEGDTHVNAGGLRLDDGKLGDGTGTVTVASGGSLGGHGIVGGNTTVAGGGGLFGQSGQVLDFSGNLTLNAGSNVDVTLKGPASTSELFHVGGNLVVDGTLSVNPNSQFGIGLYRIFQSDNPLTDNGMHLAVNNPNYELQVLDNQGQVNLINTGGLVLNFWDGDAGPGNDGIIQGGNGTWNGANQNWTDKNGILNGSWANDNFAV